MAKSRSAKEVRAIVKAKFREEVDDLLDHLEGYIKRKYMGGLFILFRAMFTTLSKHTRKVGYRQLDLVFDTLDEPMSPDLRRRLAGADVAVVYMRRSHPNFAKVQKLNDQMTDLNRAILQDLVDAGVRMSAKKWPLTYEEIVRGLYPLPGDARRGLLERFHKAERIIELVKRDPRIINLPLGRGLLLDIISEGVRFARGHIEESIEETYGKRK
ncbi:MAG: hypothetical protein HY558_07785 [Euryarchaeota archaeon]|nr:hypothetical protein [Euryarchaeota archaeon]